MFLQAKLCSRVLLWVDYAQRYLLMYKYGPLYWTFFHAKNYIIHSLPGELEKILLYHWSITPLNSVWKIYWIIQICTVFLALRHNIFCTFSEGRNLFLGRTLYLGILRKDLAISQSTYLTHEGSIHNTISIRYYGRRIATNVFSSTYSHFHCTSSFK